MVAVEAGLGMLRFLFERGKAYLSRDSIEGILLNGVQRNQVEIVQYLIQDFGFTKADFDRMDLLHRARRSRRMMKTLQNYGADINSLDTHGKTVLHYAAEDSYPLLVAFLLCRGADATIRDKDKHSLARDYASADSRVPEIFENYERKKKGAGSNDWLRVRLCWMEK
ncbi:hypothetical protein J3458_000117 [Metarhizium acridum]|uniref:uncharacterized protein n=1 Tax=Metarhizium acridum TaxID=92637 RepID=UPI001C6C49D2|nr:hypothetical protein J3458_000117 [Metarhizium acridum]